MAINGVQNTALSMNKLFNLLDLNGDGAISKTELQTLQQRLQQQGIKTPFLDTLVQNMNQPGANQALQNTPLQIAGGQLSNSVHQVLQFANQQVGLAAQGKGLLPLIQKFI